MDTAVLHCWPTTYPVCCNLPNTLPDRTKPPKSHWGGQITACDGKGIQKQSINTLLSIVCVCLRRATADLSERSKSESSLWHDKQRSSVVRWSIGLLMDILTPHLNLSKCKWTVRTKAFYTLKYCNIRLWRFFSYFCLFVTWNVMQQMLCSLAFS